jgi:outer membrane protein assembly complex protein YaeT
VDAQEPSPPQTSEQPIVVVPGFPSLSDLQGLRVSGIHIAGLSVTDEPKFEKLLPQKVGEPLLRDQIRDSIKALYASGRFSDIRVDAERNGDEVSLTFATSPNYFFGAVTVDGNPNKPTANQVANASKLQLGDVYSREKVDRGIKNIKQLMQENGFYQASVSVEEQRHPDTQQCSILVHIDPGPQALVGDVKVTGNGGYSQGQIQDMAKLHPGEKASSQRLSTALDRLRKKFQTQDRLLSQVLTKENVYRPDTNTVDYTFDIEPGPTVEIAVEGYKIKKSVVRKNVPVYEENALDDDLLNEGRRNLLNYMQAQGYFDASVGIKRHNDGDTVKIIYAIDPGPRHKLVSVEIAGNTYFQEDLRTRMQVQPAGRLASHGRYNQSLLNDDLDGLRDLFINNGFREVKITSETIDNYQGKENQLGIRVHIDEGPQTLVEKLSIVGLKTIPEDQLPVLNILTGQPFSEASVASDRDILLNFYYNRGFPKAAVEAAANPVPDQPNRMDVTYTIREGEQVFVERVLVSGLDHTKPFVVQREIEVHPGDPLSQIDMLQTQQSLYDLGIFSQVDTAVQNPEGDEPEKSVLVQVQEAKRYTFNYGFGFEVQTGTPSVGTNTPQGATGASPRVSFDVTRLNFRGRDHTITFKSHVGRLQQRGLISYDAPAWFNSKNWRLSVTGFYDNTLDVTTFTSQRLEFSTQAQQTISKASTMFYRYTYRRVKASDIQISSDEIPLLSQPTRVGFPGFTYILDRRDNPLETTRGIYTTVDGSVAANYFGSEADFSRALVQNSTYHAFGKNRPQEKKYVFARSTTVGVESPFGGTVILTPGEAIPTGSTPIPLPERFFSGGGNSHRGFGLNQAGPRDPQSGFPLGGSALFLNNLELRFPPTNLPFFKDNISFAVFHDMGNVFVGGDQMVHNLLRWRQKAPELCRQPSTASQCDYSYISHAIGLGVRYKTPIGPVRFDFGYNLNPPVFPSCQTNFSFSGQGTSSFCPTTSPYFNPQQTGHFNVYFSIGQTF